MIVPFPCSQNTASLAVRVSAASFNVISTEPITFTILGVLRSYFSGPSSTHIGFLLCSRLSVAVSTTYFLLAPLPWCVYPVFLSPGLYISALEMSVPSLPVLCRQRCMAQNWVRPLLVCEATFALLGERPEAVSTQIRTFTHH